MLKFLITQQRHYVTVLFKLFIAYHFYNTKHVDLRVPLCTANINTHFQCITGLTGWSAVETSYFAVAVFIINAIRRQWRVCICVRTM